MAAYFFDSSALVKRYVDETGSDWVRAITDPLGGDYVYVAAITLVEGVAAVTRRERRGALSGIDAATARGLVRADFLNDYEVTETDHLRIERAAMLAEQHGLRAYDAIQLASVVILHEERLANGLSPITLVSADLELNTAAVAEGLLVEDPNAHP